MEEGRMPSPTQITVAQLSRLIGLPNAPVIIDVCIDEDFEIDSALIPGAFRHPFDDIGALAPRLAGKKVVVVCFKGLKLSQGTAAILRTHGIDAESLEGGIIAWRAAGEMFVHADKIPGPDASGSSLWVTRHRPKIDRIACPWLIRRFVDPKARFLFVEPSQVMLVADRFNATPFDVEDVFWSHREEHCTFDAMVDEFGLGSDALKKLALIVRGADTNCHDLAPQAAGLLAVSLGLSRMYKNDLEQLEAGMSLYDALYRWCRDASQEGHDWPAQTGSN